MNNRRRRRRTRRIIGFEVDSKKKEQKNFFVFRFFPADSFLFWCDECCFASEHAERRQWLVGGNAREAAGGVLL
jgi:hypothetical protein